MRFKIPRVEADWLKDGGQTDDWMRAMMTASSLTACVNGRDVKNKLCQERWAITDLPYQTDA